MSELVVPKGWKEVTLEDCIANIIGGDWGENDIETPPDDFVRVKILRATEISNWSEEKGKSGVTRIIKKTSLEKRQLSPNDLILEISGGSTNFTVGRCVRIDKEVLEGDLPVICANFFRKITLKDDVEPSFIHLLLHYLHASKKMLPYISRSTNIQNLKVPELLSHKFAIPSLKMQKQIVAKLDHILGELEEKKNQILSLIEKNISLIDNLYGIKKGRIRQKTLEDYVVAKLIEPIILNCKNNKKNYYFADLVNCCTDIIDTPHSTVQYEKSGIPVIRTTNIEPYQINFQNCKYTSKEIFEERRKKLDPKIGDILYAREAPWGISAQVRKEGFVVGQRILLLRPNLEKIKSDFLDLILNSDFGYNQAKSVVNETTSGHVNIGDIKKFQIPIIPDEKQKQIINSIKSVKEKFQSQKEQFENIKNSYESTIKYIEHIQSSILDAAFSGKLLQ